MFEIDLSGVFGWDITPQGIKQKLSDSKSQDIQVNISSVGGDVFDGIDIYNQFRNHKRNNPDIQMIARMSGVVASMAAYVAMAPYFDMVIVEDNAAFMIHNSWTFAIGDKNVLRKAADMLDGLDGPMVKLVSQKTGKSEKEAQSLLDEESWFFGEQIVEAGFADEVMSDEAEPKARMSIEDVNSYLLSMQKHASQRLFERYTEKAAASLGNNDPSGNNQNKSIHKNDKNVNKPKEETNNAMNEQEIRAEGVNAENERVSSIMALKEKYGETLKESPGVFAEVSKIIDKGITDSKATVQSVLTDLNMFLMSGNVQAALESPGSTPQGDSNTFSGESQRQTEKVGEDW